MKQTYKMKPILWIGSSKKDLKDMPLEVQRDIGHSLRELQKSKDPGNTKSLRHLHEPISEIVVEERVGTFRAMYTIEFKDAIAVLHVFQKKSKSGISTPKQEIDLALQRLKQARTDYQEWKQQL
jgi:phage-related protein